MVKSTSGYFQLADGTELYSRVWEPEQPPTAHIAFLHGFSDRCDHYDAFFSLLVSHYPIKVHAWDRRGWGQSYKTEAQLGDIGRTPQILREINEVLCQVAASIPDITRTPLFVMGHSMGGQESAFYLLSTDAELSGQRPPIAGWILDAPYIGLDEASRPSWLKIQAGKAVARVLPKFKLTQTLNVAFVSRDPKVQELYHTDDRCHNTGTLEGLDALLQREADLVALSQSDKPVPPHLTTQLPCPVFWAHGTQDMITSYSLSKQLYERLESSNSTEEDAKVWKSFEGGFHQLHAEPDGIKEEFMRGVGDWVGRIVARATGAEQ